MNLFRIARNSSLSILFITLLLSCNSENGNEEKLFELLDPAITGVDYTNTIPENDTLNQYTYHYIFNGTGVATGDINNDGLADMVITGNEKPAKIYLNKGEFKFEDITDKSGFKTTGWMSGVTMADVNNDGFLDVYICRSGPEKNLQAKSNFLFINNRDLTFTESSKAWGVNDMGNATCATFFDLENDGDLDMYLGNHADQFFANVNVPFTRKLKMDIHNQQHLFRNDGGKFTDISDAAGVTAMGYCLSATPADFNRDGFMDLYVCNDYLIPDYYYINNGDGTFTESFKQYFKHSSTNSMGSDAADYNNDGWMDIITLDMLADDPRRFQLLGGSKDIDHFRTSVANGYGYQYMHNALQTNTGSGHFSDLGFLNGVARTDWSWSPLFADFDNDGWSDLFVTNGYYRDVTNLDFMIYSDRILKQTGQKVKQKDFIEKIPFEKLSNYAFKNKGNLQFDNVTENWGLEAPTHSTGSSYADLNNDGNLDLVICNQGDKVQIYKNHGTKNNYLQLKFKGGKKNNTFGIGTKVILTTDSGTRIMEMQLVHGYQSSSAPTLHIGLGADESAKKITVIWPNGEYQNLENIKSKQTLEIDEKNASGKYVYQVQKEFTFEEITELVGLNFVHEEKENPDFKREPLLPHRFTMLGPGAATGDVNGDGLTDLIITNARESSGCKLFEQTPEGKFRLSASQPWKNGIDADILGCLIFDANGDGSNDIYLAAGGSEYEWPSPKYKHHLYMNNGKGSFTEKTDALPDVNCSGSCITAGDYDADGDLDLFVAGRLNPGNYPGLDIRSYLLNNIQGKFTDVTSSVAPELNKPGMICAAVFADYNNDNKLDLVVAGEWMPVFFMQNTGDKFVSQGSAGTRNASGWYNSLLPVDIDNDGDLDFIAGNKGENSFIKASITDPLRIYWTDLDGNGITDLWMTYTRQGKEYPLYQLDEMGKAYPGFISKKFTTYTEFAGKTALEIFGADNMAKNRLQASNFNSMILINNGGSFEMVNLPRMAQAGPIYGLATADIDGNGFLDIIGTGNSYSPRWSHGRDDAMDGFTLMNQNGQLSFNDGYAVGFEATGDEKALVMLPWKKDKLTFIATQNGGPAKMFEVKSGMHFIPAKGVETKALVKLKNGKTRVENLSYGSGYLSASQPGVWVNSSVESVQFIDGRGNLRNVRS
ncbi:MAG: VCBS repeat-containing protein [Bacteroidetes bacterium]|nr:VCBS repeat-containing protein [Bacteroidota bacterium]